MQWLGLARASHLVLIYSLVHVTQIWTDSEPKSDTLTIIYGIYYIIYGQFIIYIKSVQI